MPLPARLIPALLMLLATAASAAPLAYVSNQKSGTISIIDTGSDTVVGELPGGKGPRGAAISANGRHLFVSDEQGRQLILLDLVTRKPLGTLPLGVITEGVDLRGPWLAAATEAANSVIFVNPLNFTEAFRVPTRGKNPEHAVFSPDGTQVYASAEDGNVIDVIDVARRESVATVNVGRRPRGIGFLPDGSLAYVANELSDTVSVIDTKKRAVVATIRTGKRANGVKVSPDGQRVYVSNGGDHSVSVIDTTRNEVIATIAVGERPWNMALTPDGKKLYVACGRANVVTVIDTVNQRRLTDIAVGKLPWGVVMAPLPGQRVSCRDCPDVRE